MLELVRAHIWTHLCLHKCWYFFYLVGINAGIHHQNLTLIWFYLMAKIWIIWYAKNVIYERERVDGSNFDILNLLKLWLAFFSVNSIGLISFAQKALYCLLFKKKKINIRPDCKNNHRRFIVGQSFHLWKCLHINPQKGVVSIKRRRLL